jgi:hypothetical protein
MPRAYPARGSVLVRHGKGDTRRQAGMDEFAFALWPIFQRRVVMSFLMSAADRGCSGVKCSELLVIV